MLTRRHIRTKVLQSVYAFDQSEHRDLDKQEKFLHYSIDQMQDLYIIMLQLLVEVKNHASNYLTKSQQKFLATAVEKNPSRNFIDNSLLMLISTNGELKEMLANKKLNYWETDNEYVSILFNELKEKEWYQNYLDLKNPSPKEDRELVVQFYKQVLAPNEKLYEYLEDKRLTWLDDFPIVNTAMVKMLNKLKPGNVSDILLPKLYKNEDDKEFVTTLFRKVVLNDEKIYKEIEGKTPNWDKERIADVDMIVLKMGIAEFLFFPSIPVRVTINEYLEVAKEYSTPKSSIFINGILDKLVKEYTADNKLNKIGRGLL